MKREAVKQPLDRLAEAYGVQLTYQSETGDWRIASDDDKRAVLRVMGVAAGDAHSVATSLAAAPAPAESVIAAPPGVECYMPGWLANGRAWGVTCQLYGLRSTRNHGIGDFEDLARLAETVAADGADFIGINPVHALFSADAERCSPFSPSNRRFINPLYIALDAIPSGFALSNTDQTACDRLRAATRIDYGAVADLKFKVLRALWDGFAGGSSDWTPRVRTGFDAFVTSGGEALLAHARFEALSHAMVARGKGAGWHDWPKPYRDSSSDAVRRFAAENDEEIRFHLWLQWIADTQLGQAASRARAAGMRIGLYLDFAVGTAPDGSATWSNSALVVPGANIGAPPDAFFEAGQDWGLAPLSPTVLREQRFTPYRTELETVMRHAGAIRIDHAMGLHRLYWIPHGGPPAKGCYVVYPTGDMVSALASASTATDTIVIGEDLGTVPGGFSRMMHDASMLSYKVLYFERSRGGFRSTRSFQKSAFLSASTHDLPPLAAWWKGTDIALFKALGLLDAAGARRRYAQRDDDRRALIERLERESARRALAGTVPVAADAVQGKLTSDLAAAIHAYLARTASRLLGLQFEDLCAAEVPVNVPGTSDEYPNWQLRAPALIETAADGRHWTSIVAAVKRERPRQS